MNPTRQRLRQWGYEMADLTLSQVKTLPDADMRARALRLALDKMRHGLNEKVRQRTVVLRRLGRSYPQALREALAEQYVKLGAHQIQALAPGLGTNGDATTPAAQLAPTEAQATERTEMIIGGVGRMIGAALQGALGIAGAVRESRESRRAFAFEREQWRREASQSEMRGEREYQLAQRRLASERRSGEQELLEADRERALQERLDVLGPAPSGVTVGTVLVVGGLLVVVGVGGYMLYRSWKKKREEAEE
jgi:hypothetical protein